MAVDCRWACTVVIGTALVSAQSYAPPAGVRPARSGPSVSILPGGRLLAPLGEQFLTGVEPSTFAVSPSGKAAVSANAGAPHPSMTVLEREQTWGAREVPAGAFDPRIASFESFWHGVGTGLVFSGEHAVFVSEGNTGRVALVDLRAGEIRHTLELDGRQEGSRSGDLALDAARNILYVADLVHARVVSFDARSRQRTASIPVEGVPVGLALAPDGRSLYVATAKNLVGRSPGAASVGIVDVTDPVSPKVVAAVLLDSRPGTRLAGIVAGANRVFVSDSQGDSIIVIDPVQHQVEREIPLRIPGLEALRGIAPEGLAYDKGTGWLLVAESGLNAVGVIDTGTGTVLGHLPAGWFPTRVRVERGVVYVLNEKGQGWWPSSRMKSGVPGSVSIFRLPPAGAFASSTRFVLQAAGFERNPGVPPPLPRAIRNVVLIVKGSQTFDELLGDTVRVSNGPVMAWPAWARFGTDGYIDGRGQRLSLHHLNVTPNHHAIAGRWTFSDNFYADSDDSAEGLSWLSLLPYLAREGVSFVRLGGAFDPEVSDTSRAAAVIRELDRKFASGKVELPRFVLILLPNDRTAPPLPEAGYPYQESYLVDNDLALGRILQYLSGTKWWNQMAVFVTESSAGGGLDHIDAHRTLLLCAGPWARRNAVIHLNTSFPGLRQTIFRLFGVAPANLSDASAPDLSGCFTDKPDPRGYRVLQVDPRVYEDRAGAARPGSP